MDITAKDETLVSVRNRDNGSVGYSLADSGVHRTFAPKETKKVPIWELKELQWQSGGDYLLKNFLVIEDEQIANEVFNIETEPEYFYTEEDIRKLLESGTLEQLEDFFDFSPAGGIEMLKSIAVEMKLPDTRKREVITKATGFNIDTAININTMLEDETETAVTENVKKRRSEPIKAEKEEGNSTKTASASKYKIVNK